MLRGEFINCGVGARATCAWSTLDMVISSCAAGMGDADLCFFFGTFGGDGSSLDRRLFRGSGSVSRFVVGVGSDAEATFRGGEVADPVVHEAVVGVSDCD